MAVLRFGRKLKLPVWLPHLGLFSRINIFTWSGHFKELKLIENLSDCPQILTLARLTYKQQKVSANFFRNIFFSESDFLILFRKRSITFHWNWVLQNEDTFFSALGPETEEQIKLAKDKIRQFILFQNSCYSLMASFISFDLI